MEPKPKILPKQKKILQMADKCFDLTEKWYGFGRGLKKGISSGEFNLWINNTFFFFFFFF